MWCGDKVSHLKVDRKLKRLILYLCNPRQGPKCGTCSPTDVFIEVYPCLLRNIVQLSNPGTQSSNRQVKHRSVSPPRLEGYCPKLWPLKYSFLPCFCIVHGKPHGSRDSEKLHLLISGVLPQNMFPMYKFVIKKNVNRQQNSAQWSSAKILCSVLWLRKIRNTFHTVFLHKLHSLPSNSGKNTLYWNKKVNAKS